MPHFPWSQLRRLHLNKYQGSSSALLYFLKACPDITHFSLASSEALPSSDEFFELPIISLKALIQLEIDHEIQDEDDEDDEDDVLPLVWIFDFISVPKLERLSIRSCGELQDTELDWDLAPMFANPDCKVKFLCVTKS